MKSSTSFRYFSSVFFFFILFFVAAIADEEYSNIAEEEMEDSTTVADTSSTYLLRADQCQYRLGVKTGTVENAGTDSRISISIGSRSGTPFTISDLKTWGVMKPGHDYFENGNFDSFVVNGPCLSSRLCKITVTSDGTGDYPGWYLNYVEVSITGPQSPAVRTFIVNQWLSTGPGPYLLSVTRNYC